MSTTTKNLDNPKEQIQKLLAETLGLEKDDIADDDSLSNDLHMRPSDLADFVEKLNSLDFDTSKIELTEIDTVSDLIEAATDDEYLE